MSFIFGLIVIVVALALVGAYVEHKKVSAMDPEDRRIYVAQKQEAATAVAHGPVNPRMVCPHCQQRGCVRTKPVDRKRGVSGGKATAALLTGGVSMLATGLSRKEHVTRAQCTRCGNGWDF